MRYSLLILGLTYAICLTACATTSQVTANPGLTRVKFQSAYVVEHGGSSSDMDGLLEKNLLRRGLAVTSGPAAAVPPNTDLLVKYIEDWKWDLKMYLRAYDLEIIDAKTNVLLASGTWRNSIMHGFYEEDGIVSEIVGQTMDKLQAK